MRIMIDADLMLESLLNRSKFIEDSKDLWRVLENKEYQGYISSSGLSKIKGLIGEYRGKEIADIVAIKIQKIVSIYPVENCLWEKARLLNIQDFESAIEVVCAEQMKLSAIITQIPENFPITYIPIYTVDNLLQEQRNEQYSKRKYQIIKYLNSLLETQNNSNKLSFDTIYDQNKTNLIPSNTSPSQDMGKSTRKKHKKEGYLEEVNEILSAPISKESKKPLWKGYDKKSENVQFSDAYIQVLISPPYTD